MSEAQQIADLQQQILGLQQQLQAQQLQDQQLQKQQRQEDQASNNSAVCRVSVKLPPFWADKPAVWFAQVEAQFSLAQIKQDQTKFDYVVAQLDSRYASEVDDILTNPPAADRYQRLKKELIRRLSLSEEQKVRQLLMSEELGDRKPSQFLRHMRSLAGHTQVQDSFLRTLWLQRLPPNVQAILQAQSTLPLDQVAELADRIVEVAPPPIPTAVNAVSGTTDYATLARRIDDIARQLAALKGSLGRFSAHRSRSRDLSRPRGGSQDNSQHNNDSLCWYHRRYGDQAKKCLAPCSEKSNGSS